MSIRCRFKSQLWAEHVENRAHDARLCKLRFLRIADAEGLGRTAYRLLGRQETSGHMSKTGILTISILLAAASIPGAARRISVENKMSLQGMKAYNECQSQAFRLDAYACFRMHKWPWHQYSCFGSRPRRLLEAAGWSRTWVSRDTGGGSLSKGARGFASQNPSFQTFRRRTAEYVTPDDH